MPGAAGYRYWPQPRPRLEPPLLLGAVGAGAWELGVWLEGGAGAGAGVEDGGGVAEEGSWPPEGVSPCESSSSGTSGVEVGVEEVGFDGDGVVGVLGVCGVVGVAGAVPEPTLGGGLLTWTWVGPEAGASAVCEGAGEGEAGGVASGEGGDEEGCGAETTTPWPGAAAEPSRSR